MRALFWKIFERIRLTRPARNDLNGYLVSGLACGSSCLGFCLIRCSCPSCYSLSHSKGSVSHKKSKKKKKHKHKDRDVCKRSAWKCPDGVPKTTFSPVFFTCRRTDMMDMTMTTALYPAGSVAVCDGCVCTHTWTLYLTTVRFSC